MKSSHGHNNGRKNDVQKQLKVADSALRCPSGHPLPYRCDAGKCTPIYCAATKNEARMPAGSLKGRTKKAPLPKALAEVSTAADAVIDAMIPTGTPGAEEARAIAKQQKSDELLRLAHSVGRWAAMRAYFKVPEGLEGEAAESFVQRRAMMLSVDAVTELERQLKLGDDTQRREAARDILDMNGMRRREANTGAGGPVIMLINPNGAGQLQTPWTRQIQAKVVETPTALPATTEVKP